MKPRKGRITLLAASTLALAVPMLPVSNALALPFTIHWTAPGDDSLAGRATSYDLRVSQSPITVTNFAQATRVTGVPAPKTVGSLETFAVNGLVDGVLYYLAIKAGDDVGHWSVMSNVLRRPGTSVSIREPVAELFFSTPRPNPAHVMARWTYTLPSDSHVDVRVFDAMGRQVATLAAGERKAGGSELTWNLHDSAGHEVPAGVYFVRAQLGAHGWSRRLVVAR